VKVLVLGATGRTGRQVVRRARARGHDVTALVRDPAALDGTDGVRVVTGDVRDAAAQAVSGQDAVISALGPDGDPAIITGGLQQVVAAMDREGVRRIAVVLGAGLLLPEDEQGLAGQAAALLVRALNGADLEEKRRQLELLRASDLDWIAARPPRLVDGPETGAYRAGLFPTSLRDTLSTADLADFLVRQAEHPIYPRQAPLIAGPARVSDGAAGPGLGARVAVAALGAATAALLARRLRR